MKLRDGENKVKVAEGDAGMEGGGGGGWRVQWMGGGMSGVGAGRKASFDVELVDPACCLGRTQVW